MKTPMLAAGCGLLMLAAASTARAQTQTQARPMGQPAAQTGVVASPSCDLRDAVCRQQTLEALSQTMAAVGKACGPTAGCGNPPQVGKPWERLKLSEAQRLEMARAIVLLYEGSTLTPKDIENVMKKVGPIKP